MAGKAARRGSRWGHRVLVDRCLARSLALTDVRGCHPRPDLQGQGGIGSFNDRVRRKPVPQNRDFLTFLLPSAPFGQGKRAAGSGRDALRGAGTPGDARPHRLRQASTRSQSICGSTCLQVSHDGTIDPVDQARLYFSAA
ncbi:hypothetical protein GCM10017673_44620 [Streptosporangium violaceochromogenes]|nr:hypothetical protein GCM10017673_44620 [Streptosporangium violaceochromogenes]